MPLPPDERVREAALSFLRRRERLEHPAGSFDAAGRWWMDVAEQRLCCGEIRPPSRQHPYSYLVHCRTLRHVAALYDVPVERVRGAVKSLRLQQEVIR